MGLGICRASGADVTAEVQAEPRAVRLSGSVRVTLSVEGTAPLRVEVPDDILDEGSADAWRARPAGPAAIADLPGGRQRWARTYRLDPYLEGKPLHLGFAPAQAFAGTDPQPKEVVWKSVGVTVTAEVTGTSEARPATGIEELPPADVADSLQERAAVFAALGVAVVLAGVAGAWLLRKHRQAPPPSPEEWAANHLDELSPDDPAFADRLSDVLRTFLERRSGLPATRRTTAELLIAAESAAGPDVVPVDLVRPVLERCDAAKFAGLDPTPDERRQLLADARAIITPVAPDDRP